MGLRGWRCFRLRRPRKLRDERFEMSSLIVLFSIQHTILERYTPVSKFDNEVI